MTTLEDFSLDAHDNNEALSQDPAAMVGGRRKTRGRKTRGRKTRGRKSRGRKSRGRKSRGRKSRGRKSRGRKLRGGLYPWDSLRPYEEPKWYQRLGFFVD